MDGRSGPRLLNMRNVLGAVLVAGIATGIYVGKFWKGFGGGSSLGVGVGDPQANSQGTDAGTESPESKTPDRPEPESPPPADVPRIVRVVIDDQSYFVRNEGGDEPIDLKQIVALARAAAGDEDGIRIRIYRKFSSRTSAELALSTALAEGGIKDDQTVWVPTPID